MSVKITQQPLWKLHPQLLFSTPFQGTMFVWCLCKCKTRCYFNFLLSNYCDCRGGSHLKLSFEIACPGNHWFGWLDFSLHGSVLFGEGEWGVLHYHSKTFSFFVLSFWGAEFRPVCGWYFTLSAENHFWCPHGKKWTEQAQSLGGCSHEVGLLTLLLKISALQSSCPFDSLGLLSRMWSMPGNSEEIAKSEFLLDASLSMYCKRGTVLSCILESKKTPVLYALI